MFYFKRIHYLWAMDWKSRIFRNHNTADFLSLALVIFRFQAENNPVYSEYIKHLNIDIQEVDSLEKIPFIPIQLFKSHTVQCEPCNAEATYSSSGTGGQTSKHIVHDLSIYQDSFLKGFEHFYGNISDYTILALLPSYLERSGSSLIYMCEELIKRSGKAESGFYLNEHQALFDILQKLESQNRKTLLIGVSFGLLDFVETFPIPLKNTIVMETGGMKGRRKELLREELHQILREGFQIENIHSEYGMTELLSQAYSSGNGVFKCPPWMKIMLRDTNDPLSFNNKSGGLNVIDLANVYSCSFISTQDLARMHSKASFDVIGRFDDSDVRGCNLMVL